MTCKVRSDIHKDGEQVIRHVGYVRAMIAHPSLPEAGLAADASKGPMKPFASFVQTFAPIQHVHIGS